MTYFKNVNNLHKLRKQYKELLKAHHPDNGGNLELMQEINAEYDKLFKVLKDKHESKTADNENSYNNIHNRMLGIQHRFIDIRIH